MMTVDFAGLNKELAAAWRSRQAWIVSNGQDAALGIILELLTQLLAMMMTRRTAVTQDDIRL